MRPSAKRAARVAGGRRAAGAGRTSAKGATTCTRATQSTRAIRGRRLSCFRTGVRMNNCALYHPVRRSCRRVQAPQRYPSVRPTAREQPRVCCRRPPKRLRSAVCAFLVGSRRRRRESDCVHTVPVVSQSRQQPQLLPQVEYSHSAIPASCRSQSGGLPHCNLIHPRLVRRPQPLCPCPARCRLLMCQRVDAHSGGIHSSSTRAHVHLPQGDAPIGTAAHEPSRRPFSTLAARVLQRQWSDDSDKHGVEGVEEYN